VCFQVDGQQKLLVGNLGAMEKMLGLIRERVQTGKCSIFLNEYLSSVKMGSYFLHSRHFFQLIKCRVF
jgi:hypothetical protein